MHLLVIAASFPSPEQPYRGSFIGDQVRALSEHVDRITVLSPTAFVPAFLRHCSFAARQAFLPRSYQMLEGRCEVLFPRYVKAPGDMFLHWIMYQWNRIVSQTVDRFAKTCPVSLIHAHNGSVSSWAAVCAAKRFHIPCVVTYHGSDVHTVLAFRRKGWKLCRDSFRLADLNFPVSGHLESILRGHAQPKGKCETLLLGVDQNKFYPASELTNSPNVLFVGNVQMAKGVFDLLNAWVNVRKSFPRASLTVVGYDYTNGDAFAEARNLNISDSVTFTGPLPSDKIAQLMRQSRIFCLPSHQEGTPVSLMEAMSSGLSVVSTRVGGIPEIVRDGQTGLLVEKGEVEKIAGALIKLLSDYKYCEGLGKASLIFARKELNIKNTVDRLLCNYNELLQSSRCEQKNPVSKTKID